MTEIKFFKNKNRYTICCDGHATGSVEACAAVSCLVQTVTGYLQNAAEMEGECENKDGYSKLSFSCESVEAEHLFCFAYFGFAQLCKSYPEYVKIIF